MADSPTVDLTDEIRDLLAEREQLHRRRERAARDVERLTAMPAPDGESGRAGEREGGGAGAATRSVGPLTAEQTPAAELSAALAQLEPTLAEIERVEHTIAEHRASAESLRHGATRRVTIAVAVALLLLLLLVIVVGMQT